MRYSRVSCARFPDRSASSLSFLPPPRRKAGQSRSLALTVSPPLSTCPDPSPVCLCEKILSLLCVFQWIRFSVRAKRISVEVVAVGNPSYRRNRRAMELLEDIRASQTALLLNRIDSHLHPSDLNLLKC